MARVIQVEAKRCLKNPNQIYFTCPMGCYTKYKRDGAPRKDAKPLLHYHGHAVGSNEKTIRRGNQCHLHIKAGVEPYEFELLLNEENKM
jgi:hypothetical protein